MYFVIRCNYINKITDKYTIGFFSSLSDAKKCVCNLIQDPKRDIVIIARFEEGLAYYTRPEEVYVWNDYYQYYVPVVMDNEARKLLIIY